MLESESGTRRLSYLVNGVSNTRVVNEERQRAGSSLPGWQSKIRRGENATTTFTASHKKLSRNSPGIAHGSYIHRSTGATLTGSASGDFFAVDSSTSLPLLFTTAFNNAAIMKFVRKCLQEQRTLQGGVVLGELRETLQMIRRPGRAIQDLLTSYLGAVENRTGRLRRPPRESERARAYRHRRVANVVQDTWLEYSFGLVPLLSDIDAGAKALARLRFEAFPPWKVVRTTYRSELVSSGPEQGPVVLGVMGNLRGRSTRHTEVSQTMMGAVRVKVPGASDTVRVLGFRPRDIIPTIWELIPYSFLVDYVSNVGDMIEAFSLSRSDLAWVSISRRAFERTLTTSYVTWVEDPAYRLADATHSPSSALFENKYVSRGTFAGSLIPTIELSVPGTRQWVNVSALFGRMRTISRRF